MVNHNKKYSVVIPHLHDSQCIDLCLKYLKQNSMYEHEIIEIIDEKDVYYAFNKGVYLANCETVVLLSDDMMVARHWDKFIPYHANQKTILTGYVVEPNPGKIINGPECIKYDCGRKDTFDYTKFQQFVDTKMVPEVKYNAKGWYQPLVVNQRSFLTYPNIEKFPNAANDMLLIDSLMPQIGFTFAQIDMFVYHFQRASDTYQGEKEKKRCIFSYNNFQVDNKISQLQQRVIEKLNKTFNCRYEYLFCNAPDTQVYHDEVLNYAFEKLFYKDNYDTIMLLDIDCIPLSSAAIDYVFEQAEKGQIVGNIQRSNHIENNKHVYVAPSAMCITKEIYEKLGKPKFNITYRGDVGEEFTYIAEEKNVPVTMFYPSEYEQLPYNSNEPWPLADNMPKYGIGTTFINENQEPMFYHLFQSRLGKFNDNFFVKCANILLRN